MIKQCVKLGDQIINIGPWDEQIQHVLVTPAQYDEEGNETAPAVYQDIVTNPLPEGAEIVEIDIIEGPDGGQYPADYVIPKTPEQERLDLIQKALDDLILGGAM